MLDGVCVGDEVAPSRLLFREPERGVTFALRNEFVRSSLDGLGERCPDGVNLLVVVAGGLASLGVNGEDLEERVKAALRVGVTGLGLCLSVMAPDA